MTRFLEEISPLLVGEDRIDLRLGSTTLTPRAFSGVEILVDYRRCLPDGVTVPLVFSVMPPSLDGFEERTILARAPSSILFVPKEGGIHLVRVAELFHHRWFGSLVVNVEGDQLTAESVHG